MNDKKELIVGLCPYCLRHISFERFELTEETKPNLGMATNIPYLWLKCPYCSREIEAVAQLTLTFTCYLRGRQE